MKAINEYINESIRLDEAKKVNYKHMIDCIEKIDQWNKADNIKNLMAEYMSAGDAEDLKKEHWDCCVSVVDFICQLISDDLEGGKGTYDVSYLSDFVVDRLEDDSLIDDCNKEDKEGDWDVDACIDLFNTVSMKVCKEAWLI